MSKLWIVHRKPSVRAALARATGLATAELATGAPALADFPTSDRPDAILLALSNAYDVATELAFLAAARERAAGAGWIVLCEPGAIGEARRLFAGSAAGTTILSLPPDRTLLRAALSAAFARSRSTTPAERPRLGRIAARFDAWLGATSIAGLARALDPALRGLPLLVRGRAGSGRARLVRHAEAARGGAGRWIRLDARESAPIDRLLERLAASADGRGERIRTVWLDEVDALPPADQRRLADWIALDALPDSIAEDPAAEPLRWIATAGPSGLDDRLEPALARAFVPLALEIPPLDRTGSEIAFIAEGVARRWAEATGSSERVFGASALAALADEPLWGERAELEAILQTTLAAVDAGTRIVEADALRFPDADGSTSNVAEADSPAPLAHDLRPLPIDPEADPSSALLALTFPPPARDADPVEGADVGVANGDATASATTSPTTSATPPTIQADAARASADEQPAWRRLARSLAHEIRNPLVSIRTFTELLPDHYADETFRIRFKELVGKDVAHIQDVVARLAKAAERDRLEAVPVDVSGLIERLLGDRRERIAGRRLVVLSELERDAPDALADADALETALSGLVDRALDSLPDRGDLFVTTRRIDRAGDGRPRLRVLMRHHNPLASGLSGDLDPVNHILEYVLAETIVAALGGRLTIDPTLGPETLIVIDLPAPPSTRDA